MQKQADRGFSYRMTLDDSYVKNKTKKKPTRNTPKKLQHPQVLVTPRASSGEVIRAVLTASLQASCPGLQDRAAHCSPAFANSPQHTRQAAPGTSPPSTEYTQSFPPKSCLLLGIKEPQNTAPVLINTVGRL